MKKLITIAFTSIVSFNAFSQAGDTGTVRKIYDYFLTQSKCYSNLEYLATKIGGRLSGSKNAEKAVY